jgi:hypothetical protein
MNVQPSPHAILIDCLAQDGLLAEAQELDDLLRRVAWTTGSEFAGEFGLALKKLKAAHWGRMSDRTKQAFKTAAAAVRQVWPKMGL